jgi:hypothetical protein
MNVSMDVVNGVRPKIPSNTPEDFVGNVFILFHINIILMFLVF